MFNLTKERKVMKPLRCNFFIDQRDFMENVTVGSGFEKNILKYAIRGKTKEKVSSNEGRHFYSWGVFRIFPFQRANERRRRKKPS